jgi:hypothetical protein
MPPADAGWGKIQDFRTKIMTLIKKGFLVAKVWCRIKP